MSIQTAEKAQTTEIRPEYPPVIGQEIIVPVLADTFGTLRNALDADPTKKYPRDFFLTIDGERVGGVSISGPRRATAKQYRKGSLRMAYEADKMERDWDDEEGEATGMQDIHRSIVRGYDRAMRDWLVDSLHPDFASYYFRMNLNLRESLAGRIKYYDNGKAIMELRCIDDEKKESMHLISFQKSPDGNWVTKSATNNENISVDHISSLLLAMGQQVREIYPHTA